MKMTCRDVRAVLTPHLDSELDAGTVVSVGEHLAGCDACRERFEREERLESAIVSCLVDEPMPDDVRERLDGRLAAARRGTGVRWPVLAAAALLLVSVVLLFQDPTVQPPPRLLTDLVAAYGRAGALTPEPAVRGRDDTLRLLSDHGLAGLSLPPDGDEGHRVRLLGASPEMFHGVRAVNVMYDCCGVLTAVYVMDRDAMATLPAELQAPGPRQEVRVDGVRALTTDQGDLFLGVVSRHSTELARHWSS